MHFTNAELNRIAFIVFVLSVLVVIWLVLYLVTNKELNRMKYPGNVKIKKVFFRKGS
jgi:hypothetical protein